MRLNLIMIGLFVSILLSGCITMLSTSTSEIHPGNTNIINASETGYGILHLTIPEINIQPKLRSQCQSGVVNGVQTTLSIRELLIVQKYEIQASAYCK